MVKRNSRYLLRKALICTMAVLLAGSAVFAAAVPPDVAGSAQKDAITALVEADVITGSTDGLFHPFDNLTRAQACIIIVKAINPPNAEIAGTPTQRVPSSGFSDMTGYGWAEGYVSYAVRHGIVKGYLDGTFKPGSNVTCSEMLTMVLRAAGFADSDIGTSWPRDFIAKAIEEGITAGLPEDLPNFATKEIAARMAYNKFDVLRAIGAPPEEEDGDGDADADKPGDVETPQGLGNLTFAEGKFDGNITMYAGIAISSKVEVYTYGLKKDYKKDMKLPSKKSELRKDTIHKFKAADTPCFYAKTGNEITMMVLPTDTGFNGRIYCVINGYTNTTNGKGDAVYNLNTLAAAQKVSWLTADTNFVLPPPEYLDGEVYELTTTTAGGTIKSINKASDADSRKEFIEITSGAWEKVLDFSGGVVTIDNAAESKFGVEDSSVVYVLNADGKSYKVGRMGDVKKGSEIRAFSIRKNEEVASYITVKQK
ncbi:MAG: S-layer homology domain-containing protein [Clostridiales bacterium]|nr:S-layer homology domain-containing protein [Clostridiales bacterium]